MITPELKDKVLKSIIDVHYSVRFDCLQHAKLIGIEPYQLELIVDQFEKMGLAEIVRCLGGTMQVSLTADAYDLYNRGGFVANEELLRRNIEKLLLEIESLKPHFPEKAERITSIAAGIATALGLFITR